MGVELISDTEMSPLRSGKPDELFIFPMVASALIWILIEGQLISSPDPLGGLLPGPLFLLTTLFVLIAIVWSASALLVFLITLKWRKILSVGAGMLLFFSGLIVSAGTTDILRIWIGELHIEAELSARKAHQQEASDLRWTITQTDNAWTTFVYDETDRDKPDPGQAGKPWVDYSWTATGCRVLALSKGGHLYTERVDCNSISRKASTYPRASIAP